MDQGMGILRGSIMDQGMGILRGSIMDREIGTHLVIKGAKQRLEQLYRTLIPRI